MNIEQVNAPMFKEPERPYASDPLVNRQNLDGVRDQAVVQTNVHPSQIT